MDYYGATSSLSTVSSRPCSIKSTSTGWLKARGSNIAVASLVALILFTDMLVYGAVIPCLPALVLDRFHGTTKDIGFLFGCFAIGYFIATPVFAIISDRYQNRRYPIMLGAFCIVIATLCFAWATSYKMLVLARICQGASAGASWTIGLGMLADTFPVEKLGAVMGTVITSHTVGFLVGPISAGFLYEYGGELAPFYFCTVFGLLTLIGTAFIEEPISRQQPRETCEESDSTAIVADSKIACHQDSNSSDTAFWILLKNRQVIACIVCCFVTSAALAGVEPALSIHFREMYHASPSVIGAMFMALVVPSFLGPVTGYLSDEYGRPLFISIGMLTMSIALILIGWPVSSMHYMLPSLFMFGLSNPLVHTPLMPEMGAIVSHMGSNAFAQVYALYNMAYSIGIFIGPLVTGAIMALPSLQQPIRFQILMLVFSGVVLVASPAMIMKRNSA